MRVEGWFATPLLVEDLSGERLQVVQKQIEKDLLSIDVFSLGNPWNDRLDTTFGYNTDENVIFKYSWNELEKFIYESIAVLCSKLKVDLKLFISESWINFYGKEHYQSYHHHLSDFREKNHCVISGVYYFNSNGNDGDIEFFNPNIILPKIDPFSKESVIQQTMTGRLFLFPSYLMHRVLPNLSDNTRISISFNLDYPR